MTFRLGVFVLYSESFLYTPFGPCLIEKLEPNQQVYCLSQGQLRTARVKSVKKYHRKNWPLYRIYAGGRCVRCDADQQVLVQDRATHAILWSDAEGLDDVNRPQAIFPRWLHAYKNKSLQASLTDEHCWLLGAICAGADQNRVLSNPEEQDHFVQLYRKLVGPFTDSSLGSIWNLRSARWLGYLLSVTGLPHTAAAKRQLPQWLWFLSLPQRITFCRGFVASGACMAYKAWSGLTEKYYELYSGSPLLLRGLSCLHDYSGWSHSQIRCTYRKIGSHQYRLRILLAAPIPFNNIESPLPVIKKTNGCDRKTATRTQTAPKVRDAVDLQSRDEHTRMPARATMEKFEGPEAPLYDLCLSGADNALVDGLFVKTRRG